MSQHRKRQASSFVAVAEIADLKSHSAPTVGGEDLPVGLKRCKPFSVEGFWDDGTVSFQVTKYKVKKTRGGGLRITFKDEDARRIR